MSNDCIMSFPDKHKVTVFSCEKWFRMFIIAYLFITSSLSWFPIKNCHQWAWLICRVLKSLLINYTSGIILGNDEVGWFLEQLCFANKLLEAPNCTYQFVVMQEMLYQKTKNKMLTRGLALLTATQLHRNTCYAICYHFNLLSHMIKNLNPDGLKNRQTTSHQSHMACPFHRVNHITRRNFNGDPDRSTHCNSCLFPGLTYGTYAFIAEHRSECCILNP